VPALHPPWAGGRTAMRRPARINRQAGRGRLALTRHPIVSQSGQADLLACAPAGREANPVELGCRPTGQTGT